MLSMVSVIIAVYNLEKIVEKSIQSVLNQTYHDLELIIVDDGSTDATAEVCMEFACKDKRVIYISKKNEGQGAARNMGVTVASGEYITFLDGDDWLEPDAIEKMVKSAVQQNADIVVGDIFYVYEQDGQLDKKYSKVRYEDGQVLCKEDDFGKISKLRTFTWGKLYRREFLNRVGFEQPLFAYEDTATIPRLVALADRIVYINTPVYNYLKNRQGSTIHKKEKVLDLWMALQHICDAFEEQGLTEIYREELLRLCMGQIRSLCIQHGMSWKQIQEQEDTYGKLCVFIQERFPEFCFLEEYDITVVNSTLLYEGIKNILIDVSRICCIEDSLDTTSRIQIKDGVQEVVHKFAPEYQKMQYGEEELWDCADVLFRYFHGGR